ncbi:hypothetical protein BDQ17DRAFT_1436850 [Cyathus striatus]|nr:hypothetical protein BDQ17DRAFT_1436850 [Cyathus striatus]
MSYCEELKATGGGLLEGQDYVNIFKKIIAEWEFFPTLHIFWSELPNYAPIGVSASKAGQNHANRAAALFESKAATPATPALPSDWEGSDHDIPADDSSMRGVSMPTNEEFMNKTSSVTLGWDGEEEESINEACLSTHTSVPPQTPASGFFTPFNSQVKKRRQENMRVILLEFQAVLVLESRQQSILLKKIKLSSKPWRSSTRNIINSIT